MKIDNNRECFAGIVHIFIVMSFQTLKVEELEQGTIARVTISRPKALNAMNPLFFQELQQAFTKINQSENVRVAILQAEGKVFTAGLDLKEAMNLGIFGSDQPDSSRLSIKIYNKIKELQESGLSVYKCRVPVIAGVHSLCIGGGIDLVSMCDIRYCTKDAQFTIKQIDIGMAADLGTLQLFPKLVGNISTFKELAYTGRYMKAEEALKVGFVSKVLEDKQHLEAALMETAKLIAQKSPVGIYSIKQTFLNSEFKQLQEGLEYIARANSAMLQTKDMMQAVTSFMMKKKSVFPKL